jgi:glycosyltransferase involved in cell wall biosynthesis
MTCISQNIKQSIINAGIGKDVFVIPPIIDNVHFNSSLDGAPKRKELGIPENANVILYCGSWAKWKGVDLLIEAFHGIKKEFPESFLITAWGEPYDWYDDRKNQLSEMIDSLGLKGSVIELGVVKDIHMVMAASDVFVAPFLNIDGVADPPLSILESMACGKIAIATKIASIPTIIDDGVTGFLVSPGSLDELIIALRKALNNVSTKEQIGSDASEYVLNNYGTDAVVAQVMHVYNDIRREGK